MITEIEITFESHPICYIHSLEAEIENMHPSRLTSEDIEDVSNNYQAHLEYKWWKDEQRDLILSLEESIAHYKSMFSQWKAAINPVNSQGLRYVNEEVGYVDEDEEYF